VFRHEKRGSVPFSLSILQVESAGARSPDTGHVSNRRIPIRSYAAIPKLNIRSTRGKPRILTCLTPATAFPPAEGMLDDLAPPLVRL
jgi:hypothetical protein